MSDGLDGAAERIWGRWPGDLYHRHRVGDFAPHALKLSIVFTIPEVDQFIHTIRQPALARFFWTVDGRTRSTRGLDQAVGGPLQSFWDRKRVIGLLPQGSDFRNIKVGAPDVLFGLLVVQTPR